MPASDFVQGGHGSIVSMGDFVFEQDTCGFTHEGGTGSRIGRVITQFLDVSSYVVLERIYREAFGPSCPDFADVLIGRQAFESLASGL